MELQAQKGGEMPAELVEGLAVEAADRRSMARPQKCRPSHTGTRP